MVALGNSEFIQISLLLIIAAFSIPIARKVSLVEIPILIGFGLLFGPIAGIIKLSFATNLMDNFATFGMGILGLVIILYYESHNINFRVLKRFTGSIISLNSVGMIMTAVMAGLFFSYYTGAPLIIGLLFGSIISPTDPSTLLPLFKKIKISDNYSGTLIGESLFNDPLAIILVTLMITLIYPYSQYSTIFNYLDGIVGLMPAIPVYLLIQIIVPSVVGVSLGFIIIYLNKLLDFENLIVGLLLGVVLFELTIFYGIGITPFPAIIGTGAVVGNYTDRSIFWAREANFQENLSFLAQGIIFILVGALVTIGDFYRYFIGGLIMTVFIMFVTRPTAVFASLSIPKSSRNMKFKTKLFIALSGPRGVVSVVQSSVPLAIGYISGNSLLLRWGSIIEAYVIFIVLLSMLMQTLYTPYAAGKLLPQVSDHKSRSVDQASGDSSSIQPSISSA